VCAAPPAPERQRLRDGAAAAGPHLDGDPAIAQLNGVEGCLLAMLWHLAERRVASRTEGILICSVSHRRLAS
jgi:hypothetical protein